MVFLDTFLPLAEDVSETLTLLFGRDRLMYTLRDNAILVAQSADQTGFGAGWTPLWYEDPDGSYSHAEWMGNTIAGWVKEQGQTNFDFEPLRMDGHFVVRFVPAEVTTNLEVV